MYNLPISELLLNCRMKADDRNIGIGLITDGVQPFKDDAKYGMWPVIATLYNLPPSIRYKLGVTHFFTIVPGRREKTHKLNLDHILDLVTDELKFLYDYGVWVEDARTKQMARYSENTVPGKRQLPYRQ
jgi:hypothetical protein